MEKKNFLPVLLVIGLIFGCQVNADDKSEKLVQAINGFGIDLYKELIKTNDNLICSAFSVDTVLNMLLVGARTATRAELRNVLGYEAVGLDDNSVMDKYHQLLTQQRSEKNGYDLDVANSIWMNGNADVSSNFTEIIRNKFYAEEQEINFASPEATDTINNWVNDATKGKIPELFDEPLDPSTRLVLANAIYFKGFWKHVFDSDQTEKEAFKYNDSNSQEDIEMMNTINYFNYTDCQDLNAQVLEMAYVGNEVSMYVFLPKDVSGLTSLQQQLSQESAREAIGNLTEQIVEVKIPKFKAESTLHLNDVLQNLGIKKMFNPSEADLSGINGKQDLFVSEAIQKAIIEVSEEGTVASAATGVALPASRPASFIADHPFLYFIIHKPKGLVLFTGRFVKP